MATQPTTAGDDTAADAASSQTFDALLAPLADPSAAGTAPAVAAIVQAVNDRAGRLSDAQQVENLGWDLSCAVLDAAGRLPHDRQGALLEFVRQLTATAPRGPDGAPLTFRGEPLWRTIPGFGWAVRDWFNFDADDPSATPQQHAERLNTVAFLARLTEFAAAAGGPPQLSFALMALWSIRAALEDGGAEGRYSRSAVALAATWIALSGRVLRELSARGEPMPGRTAVPGARFGDRGWNGFSEDRWQVWKAEMEAARDRLAPDETVQAAVRVMSEL
ncbi:hypothetical protein VTJ83DRAFT_3105 [Remersonia thermophila]|uniref:Uncharacterized protein n=1 Tax=Remersonia thermophila TaxID=72144 RepID=A0ABR4DFC1_9PEZI